MSRSFKSAKAHAIELVVDELKEKGLQKNEVTADLVYQGYFDELGTELVRGVEGRGFAKGSPNDFYKYLNRAKQQAYEPKAESQLASSDPVFTAAKELKLKIEQEAKVRIEELEAEFEEQLLEKDRELSRFKESSDELQSLYEQTRDEIVSLKAEVKNLESSHLAQEKHLIKLETDNANLKMQLSEKDLAMQKERALLTEYKEILKTQFADKEAQVEKTAQDAIGKSEGQANFFGTKLHELKEKHEKLEAELKQVTLDRDKAKSDFAYERGQRAKVEAALERLENKGQQLQLNQLQDYVACCYEDIKAMIAEKTQPEQFDLIQQNVDEILKRLANEQTCTE